MLDAGGLGLVAKIFGDAFVFENIEIHL